MGSLTQFWSLIICINSLGAQDFFLGVQRLSSISDLLKKILKIIWGYSSFLGKFKNFWQKIEKKSGGILNKYFLGTIFPESCEKRGISRKAGDMTEIPRFLQESGGFHWNPRFSRESGGFQWNPPLWGVLRTQIPYVGDVRTQMP